MTSLSLSTASRSPRRGLAAALALAGALFAAAPVHATDVGVSIGINQPGLYGRIDIGRFPQPALIVPQPVVIYQPVRPVEPVYLHVPPGHRKNWRAYCGRYDACGVPVYFVQERWYQDHVVRAEPRRGERWDDRRDDRRGDRWDDGHPGRGHGHGNGRGHGHGRD